MVQHSDIDHTGLTGVGGASGATARCRKTADESFSSTSFADSTGMAMAMAANKIYKFRFVVYWDTNASTVGIKMALQGPSGCAVRSGIITGLGTAAGGGNAHYGLSQVSADISTDLIVISTTSGPGADDMMAIIEGIADTAAAAGDLKLRHASETATATTIFAQSHGELWEIT